MGTEKSAINLKTGGATVDLLTLFRITLLMQLIQVARVILLN